ncbi:MAG: hypothetical protein RIR70_1890 [Pseudomonadota bacterium]|jgi:hypothetical protein
MWSFLIVAFAALGYALFSVWNAKLVPSPDQVRGRLEAQHMLVFHVSARKLCEANPAVCGYGQAVAVPASALPTAYQDANKWNAWMDVGGWLTTYSALPLPADKQFAVALAQYGNGRDIKIGWWSAPQKTCLANASVGTQPCLSQKVK